MAFFDLFNSNIFSVIWRWFMIFAEVCLKTNNVRRLADFYKIILNTTSDCDDDVHQIIHTSGATLSIYNDGNVIENKNYNLALAFTVESVDDEYQRLGGMGVKILEPPTTRPWGARNMLFEDPDGNQIAFRCFPVGGMDN
jgi:predicted enzyme related to lactoylglutathione lyase